MRRWVLPDSARDLALETIIRDHKTAYWLHTAVVMPDHVHVVITPYDAWPTSAILQRIKSVSAHRANRALRRRGSLWQDESFDRVVRADENIRRACEYVVQNPVRAGIVDRVEEYRWIWREWVEGDGTGEGACPPLEDERQRNIL